MVAPALTTEMLVVFGLVGVVVALFVSERVPPDTTAIGVVVALVALQGWTRMDADAAIAGFSNRATLTIVAMFVISAGVQQVGLIRWLGRKVAAIAGGDPRRLLGLTVGITGPLAGFVNNTPVVAMFIPMVTDLADRYHVSPSKLLLPLSYASMLGGTLTLVGTATNILASDLAADFASADPNRYPNLHRISMFEFTGVGLIVLGVGLLYLLTIGQRLLPERIHPVDLTEEFGLRGYLSRVYVRPESPLVGHTVEEVFGDHELDLDVLQIVRGDRTFIAPGSDREIQTRDVLTVRAAEPVLERFVGEYGLRRFPRATVTEDELDLRNGRGTIAELVVAPDSRLVGETIASAHLRERFSAVVLAARRGDDLIREELPDVPLSEGTGLLVHATENDLRHFVGTGDVVVTELAFGTLGEREGEGVEWPDAAVAVAILAGVIGLAALGVFPIVITALGGVVAMVVTGILRPSEAYDAVSWEVIFLLAGVIPLGTAIQRTGGAEFLAETVVSTAGTFPDVGVLLLFYLLTGLLANLITPIASVVLLAPIAVDAAVRIGANEFAFLLAVMFAASTAFMTPVGYQTNLMVYSPGGYRFTDYFRVGAPLQLLLAIVTTGVIATIWGV
jgi:di/tricarboxylate transporter